MKKLTNVATASNAAASVGKDFGKIEEVLQTYGTALNASDTDRVKALFASDGVFMPQHSPSTVGSDAIRAAYHAIFQTITFDVELQVEEIVHVAPNWAFARTNSAGFVSVHATGARVPDANHELFIFKRGDDNEWKTARYCFSTTNPPRQ